MILNGGQRSSMSARDGSFTFQDVPAGVYLLEVLSTTFHYSAMKIKIDDANGIIAIEYKVPLPRDDCSTATSSYCSVYSGCKINCLQ